MSELKIGQKFSANLEIGIKYTVPGNADKFPAFGDMPPVFATAMMTAFIEETAVKLLKPYYENNQQSVGTLVNFTHLAATPIGLSVRAEVEVTKIDGRKISFDVKCYDDYDLICEGTHERALIDSVKFMERVNKKVPK
jgi:fluoroacetyl-CoA thioesterase